MYIVRNQARILYIDISTCHGDKKGWGYVVQYIIQDFLIVALLWPSLFHFGMTCDISKVGIDSPNNHTFWFVLVLSQLDEEIYRILFIQ